NALAIEVAAVDAQMVEQSDVVGGVSVPAVLRGDRSARLAAGIALIHRDHPVVSRPLGGGIDRRRSLTPDRDHRSQPRRRESQDREALAKLLIMNMSAVVFKTRHFGCPFARVMETNPAEPHRRGAAHFSV